MFGLAIIRTQAQQRPPWEIIAFPPDGSGAVEYDYVSKIAVATNGVLVRYSGAVLTAERIRLNWETGEVIADGRVRIQREEQVWASEHITYNFQTREMQAEQFRTGHAPVFAGGEGLALQTTNRIYTATNAIVTTDDYESPLLKVRAREIRIFPGDRVEAHNATLYLGTVPVFWFPFYSRPINARGNHFNVLPGYRRTFGPFLLAGYTWSLNEQLDGEVHLDYRERRGLGTGPDLNLHLGRWGEATARYYYLHDLDPTADAPHGDIPTDRHRVNFSYLAEPFTNVSVRSMVRWQGDTNIVREFFESEYRQNPQPSTFVEVNKLWSNFSLDAYVQPRLNDFLETVERLPDVRFTAYPLQLGGSPLYYQSETSAGYYRRLFPNVDGLYPDSDYEAGRADSFHQILLPETLFGWLNVTPRVGGRFTYYSEASGEGAFSDEKTRGVFNTGVEVSFKASQTWPEVRNRLLDLDGLRHIVEPSVNYTFVPSPNVLPYELPQFDYELPSLRLLPADFPNYNAIDSIDSENVFRLGLRNKVQTKRRGVVSNVLNWDLYTDLRPHPHHDQDTVADLFSDLAVRPRSWLTLESLTRYDPQDGKFRMSYNHVTLQPGTRLSFSLGHYYLADDFSPVPTAWGQGNNLFTSTVFARFNQEWGLRLHHRVQLEDGTLQEQSYSIYRDLRSWTAALTFRLRNNIDRPDDLTVAFTFSLKAFPRFSLGEDGVRPESLWGG
jgi:lipopolysaccharide assembly outer membrane protein LptD (OstA)